MYKLLIVEDEEIEREGMRDLIDWSRMGINQVLAVEKAEEALKLMESESIDILLTDIRLPRMSGLELAQRISMTYPEVKVVIVSCMEDFQCAKKAIDLDAYGFLSKPIDMDELESVIMKVTNAIIAENGEKQEKERLNKLLSESLPLLRDRFFISLIQGIHQQAAIDENLQYFDLKFVPGQFMVIVADIDKYESMQSQKSLDEMHLTTLKILECINSVHVEGNVFALHISSGRYCVVFNSSKTGERELYDEVLRFSDTVQNTIQKACAISTTLGIGKGVKEISELSLSYKKACEAADFKFFMGSGQIIYYKDINYKNEKNSIDDFEKIEKGILSSIELCDKETLNKNIDSLFARFENNAGESDIYIRSLCINLIAKGSVLLLDHHESYEKIFGKESYIWDKVMRVDTIFDIRQWIKNIFNGVIEYLSGRRDDHNKKVINDILKIIEKRYGENLTITDIAKEVYLSMNYTSIIFKREMGESFTDYLIRYRLEKARQMLKETNMKVYQIGSEIGYSNISYFCSIFKNVYGVSPNEYRDKVLGN